MINFKTIYKVVGSLLFIEASLMFWCLIMALAHNEDDTLAFLSSVIITMFSGFVLKFLGRNSDNTLSRRDAYLVVTLPWVIFSAFGTLPFLISGYLTSFTDAYFETMSGFTTTGATIINNVEILPHGLLFWRSLTHWIGGLGIVFFTIAVLPSMVGGSVKIFAAEATGPFNTKLHPRVSTSAKRIWMVYIILTVMCILSFMTFGMSWFDAVNYSMSITGTGGFATHNNSIEFFHSPQIEYVSIIFCFLSGMNFTILYLSIVKLKLKMLFKNPEFRFYAIVIMLFSLFIAVELIIHNGYGIEHAFRSSCFQVVSLITTTGLFNDNAAYWPHITWVILALCMFLGANSGSTSGGLKSIRGAMLIKIIKNEFKQILHPNAVLPMKINGLNVSMQQRVTLLSFLTIYLILILVCSFTFMLMGIDDINAITVTLSSIGNVGPALGLRIGPTMSWSTLPDAAKWICSMLMLIGRLEIFSVLVIFTPAFWTKN